MKKQTRFLVGFLCLLALFAGIWLTARPAVFGGDKTISVEVVHQDGSVREFTYHTDEEYLGDVLLREGLVVGSAGAPRVRTSRAPGEGEGTQIAARSAVMTKGWESSWMRITT